VLEINVAHTIRPLVFHSVHGVSITFGRVDGHLLLLVCWFMDADTAICGVWLRSGLHHEVLET